MRKADIVAAIGLLVASMVMVFVIIPGQTREGQWYGLSPLFFPFVLMGGIALASVGLLIQALCQPRKYERRAAPLSLEQLRNFVIVSVIVVLGAVCMGYFGFWVGAPLVVAGCMLFMGERSLHRIAITAVAPAGVIFLLVRYVLKTPLP